MENNENNGFVKTAEELKAERMLENLLRDDMKLFIPYLEEKDVSDIACLDSGEIIVTRYGKGKEFTGIYVPDFIVERIVKATSSVLGKQLDWYGEFPILEGIIPKYNARITALMKPNCLRPEIQIRKPASIIYTLEDYLESGKMTKDQYDAIVTVIRERGNIVISGATGSGKTTCTNAIIHKMVEFTPDDNFYIVEDTPELQCSARMKTMVNINKNNATRAVEEALRFSPDRIIFGEVRSNVVMVALLDAWRTGHSGNVTTLHANDGVSTLLRIRSMLGTENSETAEHLSEVIQLIVHLKKTSDGIKVDELYYVNQESDDFLAGIVQNNLA